MIQPRDSFPQALTLDAAPRSTMPEPARSPTPSVSDAEVATRRAAAQAALAEASVRRVEERTRAIACLAQWIGVESGRGDDALAWLAGQSAAYPEDAAAYGRAAESVREWSHFGRRFQPGTDL